MSMHGLALFGGVAIAAGSAAAIQPWDSDGRAGRPDAAKVADAAESFGRVGFPQFPSLSPDGQLVAFSWAGDLFVSPIKGGSCSRLTSHPAEDRRSAFSADGNWLAFESSRDGARNLYVMPLARSESTVTGGTPVRVTFSDQAQGLGGFSADGRELLFASNKEPASYRSPRMFKVALRVDGSGMVVGGGAVSRIADVFGTSPRMGGDGKTVIFGRNYAPVERPRYRGSGSQDVYALRLGGDAPTVTRLTDDAANDSDGWMLPDGGVVFVSSRDGQNNVWRLPRVAAGVAPAQLTKFAPTAEQITIGHGVRDLAVSGDGRVAVFAVWDTLYSLDLKERNAKPAEIKTRGGGDGVVPDVLRLNLEKEVSEQVLSPDGKTLAVVARGEIFVRNVQEGYPTRRVTETTGRERDLAWSPDGRLLYFASDDAGAVGQAAGASGDGVYSIYAASVELTREDIAPEKPKSAAKLVEAKKEEPAAADPGVPAAPAAPSPPPSPDAGDAQPSEPPVAADPAKSDEAKDKPKDAEKKDAKPDHGKRWSEALRFKIESVIAPGSDDARLPIPSPDGKKLLLTRGRGDLVMHELASKSERLLVNLFEDSDAQWCGDSRHIVYDATDLDYNSDIWLMDTDSPLGEAVAATPGEAASSDEKKERRWPNPVNLTRHPDLDISPKLSADGKVLTFLSERGGENGEFDVYQIYLDKALDGMGGYERDDYFKKAAEAAGKRKPLGAAASGDKDSKSGDKKSEEKKDDAGAGEKKDEDKKDAGASGADDKKKADKPIEPLKFDAGDAYLRVRRLVSLPGGESALGVTPAADRVVFSGNIEGERALVSVDHKGADRKTLQAVAVSNVRSSLTGDKVTFVRTGVAYSTGPKGGGKVEALPIDAPVAIEIAKQQRQKFLEAARALGMGFYHPTLKGLDWSGLTKRYLSLAEKTRTNEEFNRVTLSLFNELDGSHLGITGGAAFVPAAASPAVGCLGVIAAPVLGGFRVTSVAADTPADAPGTRLLVGDVIVAIDSVKLAETAGAMPTTDLDAALVGKAGKEALVEIRREGAEKNRLFLMTPLTTGAWDVASYWDEIGRRQKSVEELSGGKLGYLHIRSMGPASVRDFERDLYAAAHGKKGLIVDVRDNGGGSTADILLASLTAPRHAWTVPRGPDPASVPNDSYPRDRRLIYGWTRPINVLINQNSFSNAEIFAHAIKTIGRGKLIGTPTFGGVISTGATTLIDGTTVRLPGRGWYLPTGVDMENNGAEPDVSVPQTPEDEIAGRDRQLEAAVDELMGRVSEK